MYAQVEKPKENKSRAVANNVAQKKSDERQCFEFVDNRTDGLLQLKSKLNFNCQMSSLSKLMEVKSMTIDGKFDGDHMLKGRDEKELSKKRLVKSKNEVGRFSWIKDTPMKIEALVKSSNKKWLSSFKGKLQGTVVVTAKGDTLETTKNSPKKQQKKVKGNTDSSTRRKMNRKNKKAQKVDTKKIGSEKGTSITFGAVGEWNPSTGNLTLHHYDGEPVEPTNIPNKLINNINGLTDDKNDTVKQLCDGA